MRSLILAFSAFVLSVSLSDPCLPESIEEVWTERTDLRGIVGRARMLPPIGAAAQKDLERSYASWRRELIEFDLKRNVEAPAEQQEPGAVDLSEALRKAKPAPMSSPNQKPSSSSGRGGETLDEHAIPGSRAPPADSLGSYYVLTLFIASGKDSSCFLCRATPLGRGQLLIPGHCVYQLDPNGDGDRHDARWAARAWAWPAEIEPSAAVSASRIAAQKKWITRGASDHDVGVVTVPGLSPAPSPEDSDRVE